MLKKDFIRSRYILKRKKNYKKIEIKFFNPLINLLKKKKYAIKNIGIYYPSNFELDILKILDILNFKKFNFLLPVINSKQNMNFYKWKKNDILFVNEHGFLEPFKSKKVTPDALIVPLLIIPLLYLSIYKIFFGYLTFSKLKSCLPEFSFSFIPI